MATSDEGWFETRLGFNRGVLRRSEKFIEKDFSEVNPRELIRKTRRKIQDLSRDEDKFKFEIKRDPVEVSDESVGEASGYARGGIKAHFERPDHDGGIIEYKPYYSKGIWALGGGLLITGAGAATGKSPIILLGLVASVAGGWGTFYSEYETFNIKIVSKLRSLVLGEVSEKTIEKDGHQEKSVEGNVSMMFAADTDIELLSDRKYRKVLDKKDVKNPEALADKIQEKRDEIYQEIYLDQYEDIEFPLPEKKVDRKDWDDLRERLCGEFRDEDGEKREGDFSEEQVNRWVTEKLREHDMVEEHVVEQLEDDVRVAKNEAVDLAAQIEDHVT